MVWTLSLLGDQRLNTYYLQLMRIHLGGCCLYGFNRQRSFGARYMAKNPSASQEYGKRNENNVEHRINVAIKRWRKAGLLIGSHGERGKAYICTFVL